MRRLASDFQCADQKTGKDTGGPCSSPAAPARVRVAAPACARVPGAHPPPFSAPAPLTAPGDTPLSPRRVHVSSSPKREAAVEQARAQPAGRPSVGCSPARRQLGARSPREGRPRLISPVSRGHGQRGGGGVAEEQLPRIRRSFPRAQSAASLGCLLATQTRSHGLQPSRRATCGNCLCPPLG